MTRPGLLLGLLLLGACHAQGDPADFPDAALASIDGPAVGRDGRVPGGDAASFADAPASLSPDVGVEAGPNRDGAADGSAPFGCAVSCSGDGVCVVARDSGGQMQATCRGASPSCRPEAGTPDAGTACDRCVGFAVCQGAFQCLGLGTPTYYCGI